MYATGVSGLIGSIGRVNPLKGSLGSSPDVTLALTGVSATGTVGTVVPTDTVALTSVTGTGSLGTVVPNTSVALTADTGTGSVGTVVPSMSVALTGVTGTGSAGTVTPTLSVALTGTTGTGSVGTAVPTLSAALTAVVGTGSVGTLAVSADVPLTSVVGTGSVGTVTAGGDVTLALTGVSATGLVGDVSLPPIPSEGGGANKYAAWNNVQWERKKEEPVELAPAVVENGKPTNTKAGKPVRVRLDPADKVVAESLARIRQAQDEEDEEIVIRIISELL